MELKNAAVLTLDCQRGILDLVKGAESVFVPASKVLAAARSKGLPIIHVGIGFRPGYPELVSNHPRFETIRQNNRFIIGTESAEFHPTLGAKPDEIIVYKHRVSAFSGNDLEMILRSKGITHLIFFGIATSGIVLSTLRQASDMDFRCTVIEDCCFDADEEVHRVLTKKVFARQATVISSEAFVH